MWVTFEIFSAKNIRILYIESAKTVNKMTLNELVKLTTLWTTGPTLFTNPMMDLFIYGVVYGIFRIFLEFLYPATW